MAPPFGGVGGKLDFRAVFEQVPELYLVLKPDSPRYTILGASNAYAKGTGVPRENLFGRALFSVLIAHETLDSTFLYFTILIHQL